MNGNLQRFLYYGGTWAIIIVAAILIGLVVLVIDNSSIWVNDLRVGYCKSGFFSSKNSCCSDAVEGQGCPEWHEWNHGNQAGRYAAHFVLYVWTSVVLSVAGFLITYRYPFAAKSGISEMKALISGLVMDLFLRPLVLVSKLVSLVLVVGAGLWVGKEGPLVHVASCIMAGMWHVVPGIVVNETMKRELLAAAVAAGISVAFNAPIGGVLYVLEQGYSNLNVSNIMWKSFICATIAVVVLQTLHTKGSTVLFTVADNRDWLKVEMFPFMILGVLGGVYGACLTRLNLWTEEFRQRHFITKRAQLFEIVLVAVVTSVVTYPLVFGQLSLPLLITRLFRDCEADDDTILAGLCASNTVFQAKPFLLLLFTGIEGFFLLTYTFGMLIPGGILMPSLAIGACFGRCMGLVIDHIQRIHPHWGIFNTCAAYASPEPVASQGCISTGVYAVIGAAAFLTGATKMTLSVVVILFELTGALTYVLPIMISVLVSKVTNDSLTMKNFYDAWLRFRGFNTLDQNLKNITPMQDISIAQFLIADVPKIYLSRLVVLEDIKQLVDSETDGFPVLKSIMKPTLVGWISKKELEIQVQRLELVEGISMEEPVSFKIPATSADADFEIHSEDEEDDNLVDIGTTHSTAPAGLNLGHLVEVCDFLPVFKSTLSIFIVSDLFYKLNYNFMLFVDDHGQFQGLISKVSVVELVESQGVSQHQYQEIQQDH